VPDGNTTLLQGCIDRLRAGDLAARDELFRHAGERLHRLARTMLGDFDRLRGFEQTDDIMQNASVRLLRALKDVTPASPTDFLRLAAAVIRRELIDLARHYYGAHGDGRRQQPFTPPSDRSVTPRPDAGGESTFDPGRLAAWTEFHEQVGRLPDEEREVFDLLWYQGLPQAEAAAILGVSDSTVKRRWMAARLRLQDWLPGAGPA
jgi:RNA polymerase sigma-70 factor (ECF subfamily)